MILAMNSRLNKSMCCLEMRCYMNTTVGASWGTNPVQHLGFLFGLARRYILWTCIPTLVHNEVEIDAALTTVHSSTVMVFRAVVRSSCFMNSVTLRSRNENYLAIFLRFSIGTSETMDLMIMAIGFLEASDLPQFSSHACDNLQGDLFRQELSPGDISPRSASDDK